MDAKKELDKLLKDSGAQLKRSRKHLIWELPDGRKFTHSATPGDMRAYDNALSDLRKLLGIRREVRKNPERRKKPGVGKPVYWAGSVIQVRDWSAMAAAVEAYIKRLPSTVKPEPCCFPVDVRLVPMTPLWCILRNLVGYGGRE
jgi:hypothetical protein